MCKAPQLAHGVLRMGGDDLGRAVEFVEAAHGQIFDEACAIDAAEDLIAFPVWLESGSAAFHIAPPESFSDFEDQAIGPHCGDKETAGSGVRLEHEDVVGIRAEIMRRAKEIQRSINPRNEAIGAGAIGGIFAAKMFREQRFLGTDARQQGN